jgi:uncharacterized protein
LDGHVADADSPGDVGNFALLIQLRDSLGTPRTLEWIDSNLIEPYRRLRSDRPGKPILQWYPDFRNGTLTRTTVASFIDAAMLRPSLRDYAMANIAQILPPNIHSAFVGVLEELVGAFAVRSGHTVPDVFRRIGVAALELEGLWDEIDVDQYMQSSVPNLYVCGDCAGHAQGILQAATSGLAAANGISTRWVN